MEQQLLIESVVEAETANAVITQEKFSAEVTVNFREKSEASLEFSKCPPITVIWSGGFDSTAVILKYLIEGRVVHTVSVSLNNNPYQSKAEKEARKAISAILVEEFGSNLFHSPIEVEWPELFVSNPAPTLIQPPIWIYIACMCAPTKEVAFGWVKYDDVWHYKEGITKLGKALDIFTENPKTLIIPFEWYKKEELLDYFYVKRPKIFHLLSTSEAGVPWSVGSDDKSVEMRELANLLREKIQNIHKN